MATYTDEDGLTLHGSPYGSVDIGAMNFGGLTPSELSEGDMTGAQGANIGAAGVGAAATAGKAILDAIAQQNALDVKAKEASLDRGSTAAINAANRQQNTKTAFLKRGASVENNQLAAGTTSVSAALGGQNNKDAAIAAMADRLAQIYSK